MKPTYLLTIDVETTSIARNGLFDDIGLKVLKDGLPPLLDLMDLYGFKSTFFYTGYIARKFPEVVKIVYEKGHEIASHGLVHEPSKAFDVLSAKEQIFHLKESKKILEDIIGEKVISFRAPALRVNKDTPFALAETGFKYDSSISPQRIDMFLSFGGFKKMHWLTAPRVPYFTKHDNLAKKGDGPILEIPISSILLPYIGTTLRIMPGTIKFVRNILKTESLRNPQKPIVYLFHPNEILFEDTKGPINRRAKSLVGYFFGDYLRRNLKLKNLGNNALKLTENEIKHFSEFEFQTIRNFADELLKTKI